MRRFAARSILTAFGAVAAQQRPDVVAFTPAASTVSMWQAAAASSKAAKAKASKKAAPAAPAKAAPQKKVASKASVIPQKKVASKASVMHHTKPIVTAAAHPTAPATPRTPAEKAPAKAPRARKPKVVEPVDADAEADSAVAAATADIVTEAKFRRKREKRKKRFAAPNPLPEEEAAAAVDDTPAVISVPEGTTMKPGSLAAKYPDIAVQYAASNPTSVFELPGEYPRPVTWVCRSGHEWSQTPFERVVVRNDCPTCQDLANPLVKTIAPNVIVELHPTKNDPFVNEDTLRLAHRHALWWRCSNCHHAFSRRVRERLTPTGQCPQCRAARFAADLRRLEPEFHPTRNGDLKLELSVKKVWWLCAKCASEWQAPVQKRLADRMHCPTCAPDTHGPRRGPRLPTAQLQDEQA